MNKEELKKYAKNLEFDMKEEEYETLSNEFNILFKQMDLLGNIEGINNYEPMDFPFSLDDSYLREDNVNMNIPREDVLSNSKDVKDNCVKSPKVVA